MATPFALQVMTPEHQFFSDEVEALTVTTADGEVTILAGHQPFIAALDVGSFRIKKDGEWREAFQSEGFVEVEPNGTHVFVQACEWPEDIDERRAEESLRRSRERMRQHRSIRENQWTKIALTRAMTRLRITKSKVNLD